MTNNIERPLHSKLVAPLIAFVFSLVLGYYCFRKVPDPSVPVVIQTNSEGSPKTSSVVITVADDPGTAERIALNAPDNCVKHIIILGSLKFGDSERNNAVNELRRLKYEGLEDLLILILARQHEKPRFRSFAVQHLGELFSEVSRGRGEVIRDKLRMFLNDRHTEVKREALLSLVRLKDPIGTTTCIAFFRKPRENEALLDLLIRCMVELDKKEMAPEIRKLVSWNSEDVQVAAIAALGAFCDEASRSEVMNAIHSQNSRVRRAAEVARAALDAKVQIQGESTKCQHLPAASCGFCATGMNQLEYARKLMANKGKREKQ